MDNKKIFRLDLADPDLEKKLEAIKSQLLVSASKNIQILGKILRRGSLFFFKQFLKKHKLLHQIPQNTVPLFMDYLIVNRIDLKDMWPESRSRLREATLENQPDTEKTEDYLKYIDDSDDPPTCKHCVWFVDAPEGEEKSCVSMGTKGCDFPCYGFTLKKMV
jgi:hypothetical protein